MKKFTVLIVDNQVDSRDSLAEILASNDFLVETAADSEAATQILLKDNIDLVFINADLPSGKSFSVCNVIKANDRWNNIPVIFTIEYEEFSEVREIYDSGGDDYILKPFVWSELMTKARIHLELKYSRQMAKNMNQILETKVAQRTQELEESIKKLVKANKDLEILEIAKLEFFNLISHEIRTPLNGIMGSLALIDRFDFSDQVNRYFSILDLSVKRLEKFSHTILEASTLRIKGKKALILVETDLVSLIRDSLDQSLAQFSDKRVQIYFRNNTTKSNLTGDLKYLTKCFVAVFNNAIKYSPNDGVIEVIINNEPDGYLKITITDRGKGFSKGSLDNIYNAMGNLEGHVDQNIGMGLHIAKLIIDAHSGFISVGNLIPTGAVVEIRFPGN